MKFFKCDLAKWIRSSIYESIPEGAILAGHDQDQSPIYIGRAWHEGDQLPGNNIRNIV